MTVTNFAASVSGRVGYELDGSGWGAVRGTSSGNTNGTDAVKTRVQGAPNDQISRGFIVINTSTLPANAKVSAASLIMRCSAKEQNLGNANVYLQSPTTQASVSAIANSDYSKCGSTNVSSLAYAAITLNDWNSFSISTPDSVIQKAAYTYFSARTYWDALNVDPGSNSNTDRVEFNTTAPYAPYLAVTFTTPPAVTTGAVSGVIPITAIIAGNVTDAGGGTVSERGVCLKTTTGPTIADLKFTAAGTTGTYSATATNLTPGTKYYAKAFVTTEYGTVYGAETTFMTPGGAPLLMLLD